MTENLWESRALPILRLIAKVESTPGAVLTVGDISESTDISPQFVVPEVRRLIDEGYIPGELKPLFSGGDVRPWYLTEARLTGKGARAVEIWPGVDDVLAVLSRLAETETDPEKRSKFQRLASTVKDVGIQVVSEVLVKAAEHAAGLT